MRAGLARRGGQRSGMAITAGVGESRRWPFPQPRVLRAAKRPDVR